MTTTHQLVRMSLLQKLMNIFFNRQYVRLVHCDGEKHVRRCRVIDGGVCARAFEELPETNGRLQPAGKYIGRPYVDCWEPVTEKTFKLYGLESDEQQ